MNLWIALYYECSNTGSNYCRYLGFTWRGVLVTTTKSYKNTYAVMLLQYFEVTIRPPVQSHTTGVTHPCGVMATPKVISHWPPQWCLVTLEPYFSVFLSVFSDFSQCLLLLNELSFQVGHGLTDITKLLYWEFLFHFRFLSINSGSWCWRISCCDDRCWVLRFKNKWKFKGKCIRTLHKHKQLFQRSLHTLLTNHTHN